MTLLNVVNRFPKVVLAGMVVGLLGILGTVEASWRMEVNRRLPLVEAQAVQLNNIDIRLARLEAAQYQFQRDFYQRLGEFEKAKEAHVRALAAEQRVRESEPK